MDADNNNSVHIVASNWARFKYRVVGQQGQWKMLGEVTNSKNTEYPAPPDHEYPSVKFPFNWVKALKCWEMKPNKQGGNLIGLDDWIEHPQIEEILCDLSIVGEIIYYGDRFGGTEITLEQAIENSHNVDPANKPPSKLPGKRKAPETETPHSSGGSSSGTPKSA